MKEKNLVSIAVDAVNMVNTNLLIGIIVGLFLVGMGGAYTFFVNAENQLGVSMMGSTGNMMGSNNMMSGMTSQIPEDVIVKVTSGQLTKAGKEAKITLLVLDKETKKPLPNADVIIGIERGPSMSSMDMMGGMFTAEDIGSGKYILRFTPDTNGYYTMHTHVIPDGKSMHSMMENHLDIGIIAK